MGLSQHDDVRQTDTTTGFRLLP